MRPVWEAGLFAHLYNSEFLEHMVTGLPIHLCWMWERVRDELAGGAAAKEKIMEKIKACWERDGYILRSFEPGQGEQYFQDCFLAPDPEVNRLTGSWDSFPHDTVLNYYNRIVDDPDRFDFILVDHQGKFIGESVINEIDWEVKSANFRIVIFNTANCAHGLGSWMTAVTRDFAFEQAGLHRLELDVFSFNHRARRVYEKAGFRVEGARKDAVRDGESYADDILMAILEDEWRKIKKNHQ